MDYGFSLVTSDEFRKVREVLQAKQRDLTRAPRGTDRSPEYNEHSCYKLDSRVKNVTMEYGTKNTNTS